MVVNWIKRWINQPEKQSLLVDISRDDHKVSRRNVSHNALKVLYRLQNSGYEAYLVGGCVRDIQLGLSPKDFDVATNATPEDVRKLFTNSRIIGRRFRIVHVNFGREVIEVTTFRGQADKGGSDQKQTSEGMLVRDNVYGSLEDDAQRRDFTINAMYYTAKDFSIKAYPQSMRDLAERKIRIIGDAETRYREDPVRMLRAIRFAAKLGFSIEEKTRQPIAKQANLLANIAPARLFDEVIKLLMNGQGLKTWQAMQQHKLDQPLFPLSYQAIKQSKTLDYDAFIAQALVNTDARVNAGKPVTPAFLYAALLWPAVREQALTNIKMGSPEMPAWHKAMGSVLSAQVKVIAIPKRFSLPMKEIWELQLRLTKRSPKRAEQLLGHPRFRAAYDFLVLREQAGEALNGLGQWWTDYQNAHPEQRAKIAANSRSDQPNKRRRRRPPASKPSQAS